ncbi:iron hydrogenase small subunit [Halodesulfovibrio marinisediminis]|uniref:Ferredoxin hydrogenase small subunit n=1 Tax=Halodesulfovibrio marinisediminis DSM 17456 TaxID=1121457 RepID=A0A1N6FS84_9BACT|nr:iron hydrogenase small subunit [Halodesulfovibrio marinisediminis]SIN98196.1 ferredoxin hydrogenase small subunit [Halodesulfovibrio marinisediminis DSM 17456]
MKKKSIGTISRRGFIKLAGITCGYAVLGLNVAKEATAATLEFIGIRQASVYNADKNLYKIRKSQDNPMIKKLYSTKDGFLKEGPCSHKSHDLLHTHFVDRSARLAALKEKGVELSL